MDFTEDTALETVLASFAATPDARLREVLDAFVRHLFAFVREVRPSQDEWRRAVEYLSAVGHRSDDTRQEFILLSDVLGVSMLVEVLNAGRGAFEGATPPTVLGPFHVVESPPRGIGDRIDEGSPPCVVTGRVLSADGSPLAGARVDVWQSDADGFYDVQRPDGGPPGTGRGLFTCGDDGTFWFRTVVPRHYAIPADGPVGELLRATGRHPYRPAHIHFIVRADGHEPLTTHIFVAGSPYIESDAVFAVSRPLIREFAEVDDESRARQYGVSRPFRHAHADFVLRPFRLSDGLPELVV